MDLVISNIIVKRKKLGLNQENMADELGISQSNYGRIENGKTELSLSRLRRISEILNEPIKNLFYNGDPEKDLNELNERLIKQLRNIEARSKEIENELVRAKKIYRGYYLLIKKLYFVFVANEFNDLDESDITLEELNRKWRELQDSFTIGDAKDRTRYLFENPSGFGFGQNNIGSAIALARSSLGDHIENYLNKHPNEFGFTKDLLD